MIWSLAQTCHRMDAVPSSSVPGTVSTPFAPADSALHQALREARPFVLRPRAFFVSWSGVLTLAFSGWPPQAVALKQRLMERLGAAVRPENPGSRWPKITLGALREGRAPLSLDELKVLSSICADLSASEFAQESWELRVESLAQTLFVWPSHERLISRFDVPLEGGALDTSEPSDQAVGYVEEVLNEGRNLEAYLSGVQQPGDISKYRSANLGAALVAFVLGASGADALPASLEWLQQHVEKALPGAYEWMRPESLHCTLRALV